MPPDIDLSGKSGEEIEALLRQSAKPIVCRVPWDRVVPIQARVQTDPALVAEYEEHLRSGIDMPPSKGIFARELDTVFLFDGIHTGQARHNLGQTAIPVLLKAGTKTEAEIGASQANSSHGAKRTNGDKRNAIKLLLRNPELCARSNNWLADTAKVSPQLVEEVRVELEKDAVNPIPRPQKRRAIRNGAEYEVTTSPAAKLKTLELSVSKALSDQWIKHLVATLDKRLAELPAGERADLCRRLMAAIQSKFFADDNAS